MKYRLILTNGTDNFGVVITKVEYDRHIIVGDHITYEHRHYEVGVILNDLENDICELYVFPYDGDLVENLISKVLYPEE